jgi:hypothetical protein
MKMRRCLAALLLMPVLGFPAFTGDEAKKDDGFVPMFNGTDLTGWVNVNCAPGTFFVKDKQIITTGRPTGYLRTDKQYENFIAEFDWMHVPPKKDAVGNSGFFVWADPIPAVGTGYTRGIEVQVLVNLHWIDKKSGLPTATSHGDLFSIWGAKCVPDRPHPLGWERSIPSENRAKGANEWNHYRVEGNNGVLTLAVNGKEVSKVSKCSPRKGYLALESEGSECRFKNLKIKELPSTNPKKEEIAGVAEGHKSLYSGLDLSGWKADDEAKKHWHARDTVLHYDGKGEAKDNTLRTEKDVGSCEFIVDIRPPQNGKRCTFSILAAKDVALKLELEPNGSYTVRGPTWSLESPDKGASGVKFGKWNRLKMTATDKGMRQVFLNGNPLINPKSNSQSGPTEGKIVLAPEGAMDFANLFVRELAEKKE